MLNNICQSVDHENRLPMLMPLLYLDIYPMNAANARKVRNARNERRWRNN